MIISASRRTDIPAFYADWFFNRLEEGFTLTRNPMNFHQVSRIALSEDVVDGFVFWTKNPIPMADRLEQLGSIPFYFQFTLTPYGPDLEPGVPDKQAWMIPAFQQLARQIGPERLVWRYDPIVLTPAYTADFHLQAFRSMAQQLSGCTDTCVISFYDSYSHLNRTARELGMRPPTREEIRILAGKWARSPQLRGCV